MPDSFAFPSPTATRGADPERRSPPSGLPFIGAAPLTAKEREALRALQRATDLVRARIGDALESDRQAFALDACTLAGDLGIAAARCAATIGARR